MIIEGLFFQSLPPTLPPPRLRLRCLRVCGATSRAELMATMDDEAASTRSRGFSERLFLEYAVRQKTSGVLPRPSCAGAPSNPYLSPARPSSLPPRSGWRARPAKLQPVPRQDLERFARRLQGWTEKHPPFRKGWTDLRGNHICGSGHIHTPENLARAWHDGHVVPRA